MPRPDEREEVQRALQAGALGSLKASSKPVIEPWPVELWRRHKWTITAIVFFLLMELGLFTLGHMGGPG